MPRALYQLFVSDVIDKEPTDSQLCSGIADVTYLNNSVPV